MATDAWRLTVRPSDSLPPLAWLLRARPPRAEVVCGSGVRQLGEAGIFEGTWVGADDGLAPLRSTTPFGSGVLVDGDNLYVVPPGHMLEGVYVCRREGELLASNSLVGLLVGTGLELDQGVHYAHLFNRSVIGVMRTEIPTLGEPVTACFHDNLRLSLDGDVAYLAKPREAPFESFEDHRARLSGALGSAFANAPDFEPLATISSGYDSAAVSVLAAEQGCRRAVTASEGKPVPHSRSLSDSGEAVARRLALEVTAFDRLAYRERDDLPEADFLATGFSGEEVYLAAVEPLLAGSILVTGFFGDGMWWMHRPRRPMLWRSDQSGSSLGEFRLRVGFVHVPLPTFGAQHYMVTRAISHSPAMRRWLVGGSYDRPIPRRILEEAGVPRGTFGLTKRAASATIHFDGPAAMAPASVAALEDYAVGEGTTVSFRRRRRPPRLLKGLMKAARRVGLEPIAWRIEQLKFRNARHERVFGSLLLRWAVSVVRPRYQELGRRA